MSEDKRLLLEPALRELLQRVIRITPEHLGHVQLNQILLIAGSARRDARASIRPLTFGGSPPIFIRGQTRKPRIIIQDQMMLYEICLRPAFFLRCSSQERLSILVHELWHCSEDFDGTLDPQRRHPLKNPRLEQKFNKEVMDATCDLDRTILDIEGELRAPMWLYRPPSIIPPERSARDIYGDEDLFLGVVRQHRGGDHVEDK